MTAEPDRLALVTGAASGIGRALGTVLRDRGYAVTLVDIDHPGIESAAAELGGAPVVVDVADSDAMQTLANEVGAVDVLCLNAGVVNTSTGPPWEAGPEEWDRLLGVNLHGVVNGLRAFVPLLLEAPHPSQVIITSSLAGALTWPGGGPYAASKHAVVAVAEQAALHLADTHVSVTVLCPALVRTGMSDTGDDPIEVVTAGLDAAAAGRFAVVAPGWSEVLRTRADSLIDGNPPTMPTPDGTSA